jgi:hypothetical protein
MTDKKITGGDSDMLEFVSRRIQGPFVGSNGAEQQGDVAFNYSTGEATYTYGGVPGFPQCLPPRSQAKSSKTAVFKKRSNADGW